MTEVANQPAGRMTVLAFPDHLRGQDWDAPQEIEVRIAGELIAYGLTTAVTMSRTVTTCGDPDCCGCCNPVETLRLELEIAPDEPL